TWKDTTFLSTDQGTYKSSDNGVSWSQFSSSIGVLGHTHGDTMTLNTIYLFLANGGTIGRLGFNLKKPDFGARMDSGVIWVRDGALLVSHDHASTWHAFASPVNVPNTIVTTLTAGRAGMLWAVAKDTTTKRMLVYRYDSALKNWSDVTSSLNRTDTTTITNVW